ncbi:MAG: TRAP transporter substrate-binding protein DctP [Deltaproteobacteria bacterium]|nr:TRAP transporter substrate-binding protein DctP [Deltaproteobacteria bacterium]
MKKLNLLLVLGAAALSLLFGGQETMAAEETFNLKFHYFGPEAIPPGQWSIKAAQRIEEKSGGRIRIKSYFSESLLKYDTSLTGTASGVADIAFVDPGLFTGQFNLNLIFTRMIMDIPTKEAASKAFQEMIRTNPALNQELEAKGLRWISIIAMPGFNIHTTRSPIRTPADMRGKKISILGKDPAVWIESMKGAPVQIPPGDWYMSLSRGLVEGQFVHWAAIFAFKLAEVFKYHTLLGEEGAQPSFTGYVINLKTWNKLPKDLQDIIVEAYDWAGAGNLDALSHEVSLAISASKEKGHTFITLTPDEMKQWTDTMEPINKSWIEETEALGLPARKTFDQLISLFKKYQ